MECTSPSLNDKEGKKYMPTDEGPQLHLNYTCNFFFFRITRLCGKCRVRYSVDAAGTEECHLNYSGTVSDRTDIRTAWLSSEFLSVCGKCS